MIRKANCVSRESFGVSKIPAPVAFGESAGMDFVDIKDRAAFLHIQDNSAWLSYCLHRN